MTELVFIEGVSGVGKSTMVHMLSEELQTQGYNVKNNVDFDYTNPIDFYCTAYLSVNEYEMLIKKYVSSVDVIKSNTINAGYLKTEDIGSQLKKHRLPVSKVFRQIGKLNFGRIDIKLIG